MQVQKIVQVLAMFWYNTDKPARTPGIPIADALLALGKT